MRCIGKSSTFLQIQTEKALWVLEAWEVFVHASPAEPQLACHAKQLPGLPEITSRSLTIHATVLCRRWPCSWVKDVRSGNQIHEINSVTNHLNFSKLRVGRVTKFQKRPALFSASASFGTPVWDKSNTKQPVVQNCSKLLPAKPPFHLCKTSPTGEIPVGEVLQRSSAGNSCICTARYLS